MHHFAISGIIIFISSFIIAVLVYFHKPRSSLKRSWGLLTFTISGWSFGLYKSFAVADHGQALFWSHKCNTFAILIPLAFFYFILVFTEQAEKKKKELFIYALIVLAYFILAIVSPRSYIMDMAPKLHFERYPVGGSAYFFFPLMFGYLVIYSFLLLAKFYRTATGIKKVQAKYILPGLVIGFTGGSTTIPLVMGYEVDPSWGIYFVPMYVYLVAYAIVKHQLMDITVVIKKSLIYTALITVITVVYFTLVYLAERYLKGIIGYESQIASLASAVIIALVFIPFKNIIQSFFDKYFFKGTYIQIAEQNELLRQEAAQAERYKTLATLTSDIVKEIKDPLTSINTYSHFLPDKLDDKEFLKKFSTKLKIEVDRINALLQHLTDYSNPAPLSASSTDIFKLLNDTVGMLKNNFNEKNIEVGRSFETGASLNLLLDSNQFNHAIINILTNAIDAIPQGGKVDISAQRENGQFIIKIRDTGTGIPRENLPKIFDPFFTTKKGHTGLGLSITRGIIDNHKGKITVKSETGKGAEFTITLPLENQVKW